MLLNDLDIKIKLDTEIKNKIKKCFHYLMGLQLTNDIIDKNSYSYIEEDIKYLYKYLVSLKEYKDYQAHEKSLNVEILTPNEILLIVDKTLDCKDLKKIIDTLNYYIYL